jgi:hypothetical protein
MIPAGGISPTVARQIDRLSRRAHAFHRYAHHPLCGAYSTEVIAIGRRVRLCRGCVYAALGCSTGLTAGLLLQISDGMLLAISAIACASVAMSVTVRATKLFTRFVPGVLGSAAFVVALRSESALGFALAMVLIAGALIVVTRYRARGPDRLPCRSCVEYCVSTACSGFRPIVRRERAFQRLAQRWLAHPRPAVPNSSARCTRSA